MTSRILVFGVGNPLAGDDGAGPAVVAELVRRPLGSAVRAETGSDVLRLCDAWNGEAEVWLVDAVDGGSAPGTIHRIEHDELLAIPQTHDSAHHLSLPESLRWIGLADDRMAGVRFTLWGIERERIRFGSARSPAVAGAVVELARTLRSSLEARCGSADPRELLPAQHVDDPPAADSAPRDHLA
jgi:hydrogenase maturation protease